jgi:formylglycine-generating enzyme required for sulfatase activity
MGSPTNEVDRFPGEDPQTEVTISKGFWMGKYLVTQDEYQGLIGVNNSQFRGGSNPVDSVSWFGAVDYCTKLTQRERTAGRIAVNNLYWLPTEAQWEYACRALTSTRFSYGDDPGYTNLAQYAWYSDNSGGTSHPVGQKLPNLWGLYDMHGNMGQWCADFYAPYSGGTALDPSNPTNGQDRVVRGGDWASTPPECRSADRRAANPIAGFNQVGFRVILVAGPP